MTDDQILKRLKDARDATLYAYEAGDYPEDTPEDLLEWMGGDGGCVAAIDEAIVQLLRARKAEEKLEHAQVTIRSLMGLSPAR